jgi:hypothetical protein
MAISIITTHRKADNHGGKGRKPDGAQGGEETPREEEVPPMKEYRD